MQIEFSDGSSRTIVSDGSWKTIPGPIVFSSIYGGEDYDAQLEQQGWDRPGFQDATWAPAIEVGSPGGQMVSQMLPPTKVTTVLSPRTIIDRMSGTRIYDLGQNISGWPEIVVRGPRGAKIEITAGELLDKDGRVTQHSANARPGSANLFSYTLKRTGDETWHPRFSYYGFRYIQITLVKGAASSNRPVLLALKGDFVHADAVQVGEFSKIQTRRTLGAMASKKANSYSRSQSQAIMPTGIKQLNEHRHVLIARQPLRVTCSSTYLSGAVL
jgi:hypothetical protein